MNRVCLHFSRLFFSVIFAAAVLTGCNKGDFDTLSGGSADFKQGKWLLMNYWATWCGPCREEIPDLNAFDQARDDVVVYGINYDGLLHEPLEAAIAEMGITFQSMLQDPAPLLGIERPRVLPSTLLISPKGKLVKVLTGPQTSHSLAAAIAAAAQ